MSAESGVSAVTAICKKRWTPERRQEALKSWNRLREDGLSVEAACSRCGVSRGWIYKWQDAGDVASGYADRRERHQGRDAEVYQRWLALKSVSRVAREFSMCRETVRRILDRVAPGIRSARRQGSASKRNAVASQGSTLRELQKHEVRLGHSEMTLDLRLIRNGRTERKRLIAEHADLIADSLIACAKHIASTPPPYYWILKPYGQMPDPLPKQCVNSRRFCWCNCSSKVLLRLSLRLDPPNYGHYKRWWTAEVAEESYHVHEAAIPSAYMELVTRLRSKDARGEELEQWEKSLTTGMPTKPLMNVLRARLEELVDRCDDTNDGIENVPFGPILETQEGEDELPF